MVKTATPQNSHTPNGPKTFCYQNGHNQNGHTAFCQNGQREDLVVSISYCFFVVSKISGNSKWILAMAYSSAASENVNVVFHVLPSVSKTTGKISYSPIRSGDCLAPTLTTRFARDMGYRMAKIWYGYTRKIYIYIIWYIWTMTSNSLSENEEHGIPSEI